MDQLRVGRSFRAIRRARRLRQVDVARAAGCSQALISAIERGYCASVTVAALCRVFAVLGADLDCVVRYRGAELDRLLDERHAAATMAVMPLLRDRGWRVATEVSFNHYGDRGSIDLLAYHPPTRTAMVVEVKTELASAEETLRRVDVKVRLGSGLVQERFGERPARVARLLAVLDSTANRNRVARLAPLLEAAVPLRSTALRHWLQAPGSAAGGLLFVRDARIISPGAGTHGSRRVRRPTTAVSASAELGSRVGLPVAASSGPPERVYQRPD